MVLQAGRNWPKREPISTESELLGVPALCEKTLLQTRFQPATCSWHLCGLGHVSGFLGLQVVICEMMRCKWPFTVSASLGGRTGGEAPSRKLPCQLLERPLKAGWGQEPQDSALGTSQLRAAYCQSGGPYGVSAYLSSPLTPLHAETSQASALAVRCRPFSWRERRLQSWKRTPSGRPLVSWPVHRVGRRPGEVASCLSWSSRWGDEAEICRGD